jgi:hypothetical protein
MMFFFFKILSHFLQIRLYRFKKVLIWPKNIFFTKFENGYQKSAEVYADFKTVKKNVKNSLTKKYRQKKGAKLEIFLFYTTNFQKFLANNFFWVHFFSIIYTDLKSAWNSAVFRNPYPKKELQKFWGHWVHI